MKYDFMDEEFERLLDRVRKRAKRNVHEIWEDIFGEQDGREGKQYSISEWERYEDAYYKKR